MLGGAEYVASTRVEDVLFRYTPPKRKAVDLVRLRCTLCDAVFEVRRGEHYGKYDFVYCGRPCLDRHRGLSFRAEECAGPTASRQNV